LALGVDEAIGIRIPTCQFLYFNYTGVNQGRKQFAPILLKVKNEAG
jgi:hypothetical protein